MSWFEANLIPKQSLSDSNYNLIDSAWQKLEGNITQIISQHAYQLYSLKINV